MAENTAVAEKKEAESRELVAKDFTEGMVVKIKQKEKFGLTFPKDYNYTVKATEKRLKKENEDLAARSNSLLSQNQGKSTLPDYSVEIPEVEKGQDSPKVKD